MREALQEEDGGTTAGNQAVPIATEGPDSVTRVALAGAECGEGVEGRHGRPVDLLGSSHDHDILLACGDEAVALSDAVGPGGASRSDGPVGPLGPQENREVHGGGGVTSDFPLSYAYGYARALRLADGPDEVHNMSVAKLEMRDKN